MEPNTNEFELPDEKVAQKILGVLESQAHEGALFSDWSRAFCTIQLVKWIDEQIQDSKNSWISADNRDKAEAIRLQAQSYTKTKNWIVSKIRSGELAALGIKKFHDEGIEMEGLIKPPAHE